MKTSELIKELMNHLLTYGDREYLEYWMHEADYWRDQCNADD